MENNTATYKEMPRYVKDGQIKSEVRKGVRHGKDIVKSDRMKLQNPFNGGIGPKIRRCPIPAIP
jgi:hypothetical protein